MEYIIGQGMTWVDTGLFPGLWWEVTFLSKEVNGLLGLAKKELQRK